MQNSAKGALRKQIREIVQQLSPENRSRQTNAIAQKVWMQIKWILMSF